MRGSGRKPLVVSLAALLGVMILPVLLLVPFSGALSLPGESAGPLPSPLTDPLAACRLDPAGLPELPPRSDGRIGTTLHTCGGRIFNQNGQAVQITGISWFGMETGTYAPHGLWTRSWRAMLDQIADLGFNTIRLPFSDEALTPNRMPQSINYELNPDLTNKTSLEVMDTIVQGASERGLKVLLDRHRPNSQAQSELWYTDMRSEQQWIDDWVMLAQRYQGTATVIGVDLHNEPRGPATWGSEDDATDWRLAAERAGNAILDVNPYLLIFVQGVERYGDDWYWWGGNLAGAGPDPVRLNMPGRLVYSPHDYGPGVYDQPWFESADFPGNLPSIWDTHWGYLVKEHIAPVVLGEFGGRSVGDDTEGTWQRSLMDYAQANSIGWLNWSFNPDSSDTGGLLADDWLTVVEEKAQLYRGHLAPPLDVGYSGAFGRSGGRLLVRARSTSPSPQTNNLGFVLQVVNDGPKPVDLHDLEVRYWYRPGKADKRVAQLIEVDYAAVGSTNIRTEIGAPDADGVAAIRIQFADTAGALKPYASSGDIMLRVHKSDWSNYDQQGDFSFKHDNVLSDWDQVGLYRAGQLVWGNEPPPVGARP
jgi:endoglucanase